MFEHVRELAMLHGSQTGRCLRRGNSRVITAGHSSLIPGLRAQRCTPRICPGPLPTPLWQAQSTASRHTSSCNMTANKEVQASISAASASEQGRRSRRHAFLQQRGAASRRCVGLQERLPLGTADSVTEMTSFIGRCEHKT